MSVNVALRRSRFWSASSRRRPILASRWSRINKDDALVRGGISVSAPASRRSARSRAARGSTSSLPRLLGGRVPLCIAAAVARRPKARPPSSPWQSATVSNPAFRLHVRGSVCGKSSRSSRYLSDMGGMLITVGSLPARRQPPLDQLVDGFSRHVGPPAKLYQLKLLDERGVKQVLPTPPSSSRHSATGYSLRWGTAGLVMRYV